MGAPLELSMPSSGEHFAFRSSARTSGLFRFVWTLAPGKSGPPEHLHPHETETFQVVSGRLEVWLAGERRELGPGDRLAVPPGVAHRFLAPGPDPAVVEVSLDGDRFEDQFIPMAKMLPPGQTALRSRDMMRGLPHVADSFRRGAIAPPPGLKGRVALGVLRLLAGVAWLFGARKLDPVLDWEGSPGAPATERQTEDDSTA